MTARLTTHRATIYPTAPTATVTVNTTVTATSVTTAITTTATTFVTAAFAAIAPASATANVPTTDTTIVTTSVTATVAPIGTTSVATPVTSTSTWRRRVLCGPSAGEDRGPDPVPRRAGLRSAETGGGHGQGLGPRDGQPLAAWRAPRTTAHARAPHAARLRAAPSGRRADGRRPSGATREPRAFSGWCSAAPQRHPSYAPAAPSGFQTSSPS